MKGDRLAITLEEMKILRLQIERIWDGNADAIVLLRYVFHSFRRWNEIFDWMIQNNMKGARLVEYYKNEGDKEGRGLLGPTRKIIEHIDAEKVSIKNELKNIRDF